MSSTSRRRRAASVNPNDPVRPDPVGGGRATAMFDRDVAVVAKARAWLAELLEGNVTPDHAGDIELVLGELVTNALRHGRGSVGVRVDIDPDGTVSVAVTDSSEDLPVILPPDSPQVGGFGLRIVDSLCTSWGVAIFPGGKTVWAAIGSRST